LPDTNGGCVENIAINAVPAESAKGTQMKWFAETTDWKGIAANHVYLMDDAKSKMFAYVPFGTGRPMTFANAIRIDVRGRKFKLNAVQYETTITAPEPEGRVWEVTGSRGDVYKVTELHGEYSCTCSGFRFRGDCKHVKGVK
jgi:hypothetical protein